jgi:hypothetical protein
MPSSPDPMTERETLSHSQGGSGVALRGKPLLTQLGVPTKILRSPVEGTGATVYLLTNFDTAYDGAQLDFIIEQFGVETIYDSVIISAGEVSGSAALSFTAYGAASDSWYAQLTLNGVTTPAAPLVCAICSFGVEALTAGGGGSGITQLTGDVLAGPGSGTVSATVVAIHGASVPAAGALTPGNVLMVSGASALSYGPLDLANAASVTGELPVLNIAPSATDGDVLTTVGGVTAWAAPAAGGIDQLTQDVLAGPGTGSVPATVVQAQAGVLLFQTTGEIDWAASASLNKLSADTTTGVTPLAMELVPQGSTNANGDGSSLRVQLTAPLGTGTYGVFTIESGGNVGPSDAFFETKIDALGSYLWLGPGAVGGLTADAILSVFASVTTLDAQNAELVISAENASLYFYNSTPEIDVATGVAFAIGASGGGHYGGGAGSLLYIADATTDPSTAISGGVILGASGGNLGLYPSGVTSPTVVIGSGGGGVGMLLLWEATTAPSSALTNQVALYTDPTTGGLFVYPEGVTSPVLGVASVGIAVGQPIEGLNEPVRFKSAAISMGTSGITTLSAADSRCPYLILSSGGAQTATTTLDFTTNAGSATGAVYFCDVTAMQLGAFSLTFKNGTTLVSFTAAQLAPGYLVTVGISGADLLVAAA